ncbi:MAG: Tetratricopeptide repeat-containing protein [Verrucomicrobiaceae bacterium]|nr:Tetratricopeptide repeat-containing protein [Verrucomicrobiaceae bacterium]
MSSKAPVIVSEPQQSAVPETPPLEQFLETNFRKIVISFIVVIIAALAYGVVSYQNRRAAEAAAIETTAAKTVEDCDLVVQHHPGTVAAGNALLNKARLLWDQNKKDTAIATLRDFVAKYSSHPFFAQGSFSLASRLESLGGKNDVAEAKAIYEKLVKEQGKTDIAALAQLRLGDMLWAEGKQDEAKKVYESLPQKMTGSPFFEHNEERLKWLAADLPTKEVEGPKPPPDSIKAPSMNLNSGASKSPLGNLMDNIKVGAPEAKIDVKPAQNKPLAIPAVPKPGVITPGAAIPLPVPPRATTSAPVQAPAAAPAPAVVKPEPAPVSTEPVNPAKPSSAANPPPEATTTTPAPEKK